MAKEIKWNAEKGQYELTQFTSVEAGKKYIDSIALTHVVIQNDQDYNAVKESRRLVNKEHDDIADARKKATAVILTLFKPVLEELEKYAQQKSDELTELLYAYKEPPKREKKSWKLEVTFDNEKAYEKVKKIALQYSGKIKE